MLKIKRSQDRPIFNMGIPILVRWHLYIETAPDIIDKKGLVFDPPPPPPPHTHTHTHKFFRYETMLSSWAFKCNAGLFQGYLDLYMSFEESIYGTFIRHQKSVKDITSAGDYPSQHDFYHSILDLRNAVEKQMSSVLNSHIMEMKKRASKVYLEALDYLIALESYHQWYDMDMTNWVRNLKLWRKPVSHVDIMPWKRFPHYWPFVRGTYRSSQRGINTQLWCFFIC